ncbi:MAG: L-seryl-tRNA(Sec) selenium transferase [Treponema sp.]
MHSNSLAHIPQIERLLSAPLLSESINSIGRPIAVCAAAEYIRQIRENARNGGSIPSFDVCVQEIHLRCMQYARQRITRVINATGIILHTNLGRSPLLDGVWDAVKQNAESYSAIEMDLEDGKRGMRFPFALYAMQTLVGAEAALMLNNNAAAVFLLLKALAEGKEVIVTRGQQVQIGGGFRIPDILKEAGCTLVEVGTTNITTLDDITNAITEHTALFLWVHTSNYRIRGFTESPSLAAIKAILPPHVLLVADQGSGNLDAGIPDEPPVAAFLKAGADLVCFSGDKMLGGPQCGWIVGKKQVVDCIARHPLMRTYRVSRIIAALMEETLIRYLNNGKSAATQALFTDQQVIKRRSEAIAAMLPEKTAFVIEYPFSLGGGSTPDTYFPSWAICLHGIKKTEAVKKALRFCRIPIIAFISEKRLLLHLASVKPSDDAYIAETLLETWGCPKTESLSAFSVRK